jgi:16S rRNA (guanine(966)-N(2))-methyltransferase RsmD
VIGPKGGGRATLRVIAGRLKGRRLVTPAWDGLRPTSDRLRETLFNVLAPRLPGARFVDGFAGTGAVGIEALSRGAAAVTFVECDTRALALIAANLRGCGVRGGYTVVARPWQQAAGPLDEGNDLVFLDPPYDFTDLDMALVAAVRMTAAGGIVVLEHDRHRAAPAAPPGWSRARELRSGDSTLSFYTVADQDAPRQETQP